MNTQTPAISPLALGPAVNINITLEMLQLLARASAATTVPLSEDEKHELEVFAEMVADTVEDPGKPGTTYGFCL